MDRYQYSQRSHSLWGVWVEILVTVEKIRSGKCHSLWGVWVEIMKDILERYGLPQVTPFGECGLK